MRAILWTALIAFMVMGAAAASVNQGSAALLCLGLAVVCGLLLRVLW